MPDFNEILKEAQKLNDVVNAEVDRIDTFDRALLDGSGLFFEIVFGHIFGFQWLRKIAISKISVVEHTLRLPYFNYRFSLHRDGAAENIKNISTYAMLHYSDETSHFINKYELPFVLLHWIGAHIGKVVGWLVASPFAALGYVGKKLYYGIKKAVASYILQKEILKFDAIDLVQNWFANFDSQYLIKNYINKFVAQLSPRQVLDGIFADSNVNTTLEITPFFTATQNYFDYLCTPRYDNNKYSELEMRWNSYNEAREIYLENERKWALAKTIVSGVLILPLFFTIPSYKEFVSFIKCDKIEVDKIANDLQDHKDHRYTRGRVLLEESKSEKAKNILITVPVNSQHYADAMSEVGHILLGQGAANESAPYFELSNEPRAHLIAEKLAANPALTLGEIGPAYNLLPSSVALGRLGTFARSAQGSAELKSLDDDEDLSTRLLRAI